MTNENVEEIKRYIGIIAEDFKDKLNFVIDAQMEMRKDIAELKVDVAELKTDVRDLKDRMTNVETDVRDIKDRMINVETELISHRDSTEMHAMRAKRKRKTSA